MVFADDDPIVRYILRGLLQQIDCNIVAEAPDGKSAVAAAAEFKPEILLLDLLMPDLHGLAALRQISKTDPQIRTIILTGSVTKKQILEALQLGARGVMLKSAISSLFECIRAVRAGEYWINGIHTSNVLQVLQHLSEEPKSEMKNTFGLTDREMEVVRLVCEGLGNKEIAHRLRIAGETVKRHMTNIFNKVGMSSRLELALFAIDHQLVERDSLHSPALK